MPTVLYQGKIDGEFEGFDDEAVFKMMNGTYWIQARYEYWYHYAYCPDAILTEEKGHYNLTVADRSIEVYPLTDVIESRIDGPFEGWQGDSKYRLTNGQVWQQSAYKYQYKYAYRPEAIVYRSSSGHKMMVAGTIAKVRKIR